jgi:hypothetical protein
MLLSSLWCIFSSVTSSFETRAQVRAPRTTWPALMKADYEKLTSAVKVFGMTAQ